MCMVVPFIVSEAADVCLRFSPLSVLSTSPTLIQRHGYHHGSTLYCTQWDACCPALYHNYPSHTRFLMAPGPFKHPAHGYAFNREPFDSIKYIYGPT